MTADVVDAVSFVGLGVYTPAEISLIDPDGGIWPVGSPAADALGAVGPSLIARALLVNVNGHAEPLGELSLAVQMRQAPRALTAIEVRTRLARTRIGYYVGTSADRPDLVLEEFWWNDGSIRFGLRSLSDLATTILTNLDMETSASSPLVSLPDDGVAVVYDNDQLNAIDSGGAALGVRQCLADAYHVMTVTSSDSTETDAISVVTVAHSSDSAWLLVSTGDSAQLAYQVTPSLLTAVLQAALEGTLASLVASALSQST